jgi:hypothetical protein
VVNITPRPLYALQVTLVPNEKEGAMVSEPVWTFWRNLVPLPGYEHHTVQPEA